MLEKSLNFAEIITVLIYEYVYLTHAYIYFYIYHIYIYHIYIMKKVFYTCIYLLLHYPIYILKRNVRKILNFAEIITQLNLWVCVLNTCIYLLLHISNLHTEEKIIRSAPQRILLYNFTFAYIGLPYKLLL